MKQRLLFCILCISFNVVFADTYNIGGKNIEIPTPVGFTLVTEKMTELYRFANHIQDPKNQTYALLVTKGAAKVALTGAIPDLDRYFYIKVPHSVVRFNASKQDFAKLRAITNEQVTQLGAKLEKQVEQHTKNISKSMSNDYKTDVALKVSNMVFLEPHFETDEMIAYSILSKVSTDTAGIKEDAYISVTTTQVLVKGKIVNLLSYASKKDLEWTREIGKVWAKKTLEANNKFTDVLTR